jgi:hypothetical protein
MVWPVMWMAVKTQDVDWVLSVPQQVILSVDWMTVMLYWQQTCWEVGVQFQATPFLSEDGLYDLFPPSSWQRQPSVAGGDTSVKSVV